MPNLEITTEQVIDLISQLSPDEQYSVLMVIQQRLQAQGFPVRPPTSLSSPANKEGAIAGSIDDQTQTWLDADLVGESPIYDWGEGGIPTGRPVVFVQGTGLVIQEG